MGILTILEDSVVEDPGMPCSCSARRFTPSGIYEGLDCKESKQKGSRVPTSHMRAQNPSHRLLVKTYRVEGT